MAYIECDPSEIKDSLVREKLRDEFAMLAAESLMLSREDAAMLDAEDLYSEVTDICRFCYVFANSMLVAREEMRIKEQ